MKYSPIFKVIGVVLLVLASTWAIRYLEQIPSARLAQLMGITVKVSDIDVGFSETPTPRPPGDAQLQPARPVVAVQAFAASKLARQGTGIVVSSDGLVLASNAVAPYGSGSYTYQVVLSDGTAIRAIRVGYDAPTNLALLKADAEGLDSAVFDVVTPEAGGQLLALAAQVMVSRYVPLRVPVSVVYVVDEKQIALSLDRTYLPQLIGAPLTDRTGRIIGLMRTAPSVGIIPASAVNAFIDRYLATQ
jgi:hypothetical protein